MIHISTRIEDSIWCKLLDSTPGNMHFGICAWNISYLSDVYRLKIFILDWCKEKLNTIPKIDVTYDKQGDMIRVHCLYVYFKEDTDAMAFKLCWENV